MAARRLLYHFLRSQPQPSLRVDASLKVPTSSSTIFTRNDFFKRSIQSKAAEKVNQQTQLNEGHDVAHGTSTLSSDSIQLQSPSVDNNSALEFAAVSNLKPSPRHDLAAMFTCKVCETRSIKTFCRESYEKGVVVARCTGCNNLHLLADRLGWFGQPGSIEDLLAARGEEVKKGSVDTLSLTLEELAGTKSSQEITGNHRIGTFSF